MNHVFHEHTTTLTTEPPHLYGRWRRDPLMRLITGIRTMWFPFWGAFERLQPLPESADRLVLEIVDRQVMARDENVIALTFAAPGGAVLPQWHPGAHLDLHLASGRMRSYSLCGDPGDRHTYRIAVRRIPAGGGGSSEVHDTLRIGDAVSISGPRNAFPVALPGHGSPAHRLRFVAAGSGITPILPMLALADRFGIEWTLLYSGRTVESIPFLGELERYGSRVTVRTDDVDGLPTMAELVGPVDGTDAALAIYCCGPVAMLEKLRSHLAGRGDIELHFERFAPPPIVDGTRFEVVLNSTGETIPVAADESALAAIRHVRPDVPYSCQQGFCGACKMQVSSGEVDHRDGLLTEPERAAGYFLPCVSRCTGATLTVDL